MSLRLTWFRGCFCPVASAWFTGRGAVQGGLPRQRRHQAHGRGWRQLGAPGESWRLEMVLFLFFLRCILALPCGWYILIYYSYSWWTLHLRLLRLLMLRFCNENTECATSAESFARCQQRHSNHKQWVEVSRKQKTLLRKQKNTVDTCTTVRKVVTHTQLLWRAGLMSTFNSVQDTPRTLDLYRYDRRHLTRRQL